VKGLELFSCNGICSDDATAQYEIFNTQPTCEKGTRILEPDGTHISGNITYQTLSCVSKGFLLPTNPK